eukprot:1157522-Pelagomonas_calceolata.AAC.5
MQVGSREEAQFLLCFPHTGLQRRFGLLFRDVVSSCCADLAFREIRSSKAWTSMYKETKNQGRSTSQLGTSVAAAAAAVAKNASPIS